MNSDTYRFIIDPDTGRIATPGDKFQRTPRLIHRVGKFMVWYVPGGDVWNGNYCPRDYAPPLLLLLEEYEHYYSMSDNYGPRARLIERLEAGGAKGKKRLISEAERLNRESV